MTLNDMGPAALQWLLESQKACDLICWNPKDPPEDWVFYRGSEPPDFSTWGPHGPLEPVPEQAPMESGLFSRFGELIEDREAGRNG